MEVSKITVPYGNSTITLDIKDATARSASGVSAVKVGTTQYSPTNGIISLPAYPNKMSQVANISTVALTADVSSSCSITAAADDGKMQTIIYTNNSGSDKVVTVPTGYKTPNNLGIELTIPDGGYGEINYLRVGSSIYARGL